MVAYWLNEPTMHIAPEVLPAAVEHEAAPGQVAVEDGGTHVADVLLAGGAPPAHPAVGDERADDMVSRLDP